MKQERPPSTPFRRRIDRQGPDKTREREASDWAQDHRGKPAYKTAPSAGRAVSRLVKPLADRFGAGAGDLGAKWALIVGQRLAGLSYPERLQSTGRGLTLVVRAKGPAAPLIEAQAPLILQRVKQYSGKAPARIQILQGDIRPAQQGQATQSRITKVSAPAENLADTGQNRLERILDEWAQDIEGRETRK